MSKKRSKAAEENRRRFEAHSHEKGVATRQANRQRLVLLGKELANGLHPVRMDSIADQLDEVDPKVRGMVAVAHRPTPPAFVPPRFQPSLVREKQPMSYTSPHIVAVRKLGTKGKQQLALALPPDIVEAIGFDHLATMRFSVELDEGGMTFRAGGARPIAVPTWALKKAGVR